MKKSDKEMEEVRKKNEESKRRPVLMVVLNSTLNFCTRVPLMFTFVNELRLLIQPSLNRYEKIFFRHFLHMNRFDPISPRFVLKYYCSTTKACLVFQSFGNCLYLFSLSSILFFLKLFDQNFKNAYEDCFIHNSSKAKHNAKNNELIIFIFILRYDFLSFFFI